MRALKNKIILEEPVDTIVKQSIVEDIEDTEIEKQIEVDVEPELVSENEVDSEQVNNGIASLLNADIIDEFEAIDSYNSHIITVKDLMSREKDEKVIESYKKIIEILTDIVSEENIHVGQLQGALSLVSSHALFIKDGEKEAEETIEEKN